MSAILEALRGQPVQSMAEGETLLSQDGTDRVLFVLRYFGPEVNPDAPAMGAYRKNKFN